MSSEYPRNANEYLDYLARIERLSLSRRRLLQLTAGATATAGLLAACGKDNAGGAGGGNTKGDTLVVASPSTPSTLDNEFATNTQSNDVIGSCYDNLVAFKKIRDPESPEVSREDLSLHDDEPYGWALEGKLADSWELLDGGRKAIFQIKKGIKSNWGNELTAEDVKWTWDRKFGLAAIGAFMTGVLRIDSPDAVKVEGPYTVSFQTAQPNPLHLTIHANLSSNIFDSKKLSENPDDEWGANFLKTQTAGFGPYKITELTQGSQAIFTARDDYYGTKPALKTIVYREVPSSAQRAALIQAGDADVALFLLPREYKQLATASGVRVDSVEGTQMNFIFMNIDMKPFDDVRVRQAMNYAFPQQAVVDTIYSGYAKPLGTGMAKIYPGATEAYAYHEDLDRAKQLLQEAGLPSFSTTLGYNAGIPTHEEIATLYQTNLRNAGVEVKLEKLPFGQYGEEVTKETRPMMMQEEAAWNPDPGYSNFLYFYSKSFPNHSNYNNPEVDRLIEEMLETVDLSKSIELCEQCQKIYMEEAPWVFVARPNPTIAARDNVHGWVYQTSNQYNFQNFSKS